MIRRSFAGREAAPAAGEAVGRRARRARRRRPAVEALEGRALLSFLGSETRVSLNPQRTTNFESDSASSSNGTSVAVWVNAFSPSDHDIWAQRFDQSGHAVGAPIPVDFTRADSFNPRVAMDGQGQFVVAWQDYSVSDGASGVLMRYFSASGSPLTGITRVTPVGSTDSQPDVAASSGSFVIAWTHRFSPTDNDIWAERFAISGGVPSAQGTFGVNTDSSVEGAPSVAMAPDGRFDIAYQQQFIGSDFDIRASQYDQAGHLVRASIGIDFDANPEANPSVSMDDAGNAVVAYQRLVDGNYGIYANRLSSGGSVGGLITVRNTSDRDEIIPSVALAPTGGRFVVAYESANDFEVAGIGSDDSPLAKEPDVSYGERPAISIDGLDRYLATYGRYNVSSGHYDIFSRRDFLGPEDQVSLNFADSDNIESDNASSSNGTSVAVWVSARLADGFNIWAQRFDKEGRAAGAPIPVDITTADSYAPHVSMDGQGRFVVTWQDTNPDDTTSVLMRYFSATGAPLIGITQVGAPGATNSQPDVAASDGSFVIAWTHHTSSTNDDIRAERFVITGGVPQGQGTFGVNTDANVEGAPSVAMAPDGRFDIAYQRQSSGSDWDIFASQYGSTGTLLRGNIAINRDSDPETNPSIAMDNAGNAVVAYQELSANDWGISVWGIYANRLSSGGLVGGRILVYQFDRSHIDVELPSVALAPTGGRFVVAYQYPIGAEAQVTEVGADDSTLASLGMTDGFARLSDQLAPAISIDGFGRYVVTCGRIDVGLRRTDQVISQRHFLS